ncbi:hypothetical protein [Vibrio cholerae]|uniref:hypothetical protein n=1 Tax=Vibrio cholerae TaxID=666 RepID=UPI003530B421
MTESNKNIYISVLEQYPLDAGILSRLHCVSSDEIGKWPDKNSVYSPDFSALYELYMLIQRLDLSVPHVLLRRVLRSQNRVVDLVESLHENPVTKGQISKQRRTRTKRAVYYYGNKPLYVREIAKELGLDISRSTIIAKIRAAGLKVGDSIDHVDFSRKRSSN